TFGQQDGVLIFQCFQPADAAADNHTEAISIELFEFYPAVLESHSRCRHCELYKTIGAPRIFWVAEKRLGVKATYFTGNLAIVTRGVESVDPTDAADALLEIRPERLHVVAHRRHGAQTCDDDPAVVIH